MTDGFFLPSGAGQLVSMRGTELVFKAKGARPAGGPTFYEFLAAPGFSTGDQIHGRIEEIFYVIEGEVQIRIGDEVVRAKPGDCAIVPPGVPHGFGNPGNIPAKMVTVISPGNVHERYFEELGEILAKPGAPDVSAIAALRARYDTEQVSPLTA
jgi:mannose-6-phosphate isomerase-like protein (cupin superfamily)